METIVFRWLIIECLALIPKVSGVQIQVAYVEERVLLETAKTSRYAIGFLLVTPMTIGDPVSFYFHVLTFSASSRSLAFLPMGKRLTLSGPD